MAELTKTVRFELTINEFIQGCQLHELVYLASVLPDIIQTKREKELKIQENYLRHLENECSQPSDNPGGENG